MSDKVYRAATCAVRVITSKTPPEGVLLGIVENFSCGKTYQTELLRQIGSFHPADNVLQGEEGHFSWGKALTREDLGSLGVFPTKEEMPTFRAFTLRIVDTQRKKILVNLYGALANSADIAINAQQKLNENVSGSCVLAEFVAQALTE